MAEALRRTCRATDLAARYGGDEFIVLAVNTPATEARVLALRIRDSVRRLSLRAGRWSKATEPINHTVSIGAADLRAAALPTFDALHAAADRALYAAKAAGRDGVVVAPPRMRRPRRIRVGGAAESGADIAPFSDQTTYHADQLVGRARLAKIVVPQAFVRGSDLEVVARNHDQGDGPGALVGAKLTRRLSPVHLGQAHVHHDDVRSHPYSLVDRDDSVLSLLDVESRQLQVFRVEFTRILTIVDQQYEPSLPRLWRCLLATVLTGRQH